MKKLIVLSAAVLAGLSAVVYAQTDNLTAYNDQASTSKITLPHPRTNSHENRRADRVERVPVSYQSQQQFLEDFGAMSGAVWERDGIFDKVTFTDNGITKKAFYDMDGALVGTVVDKAFSDLPANAQQYINRKYADYAKGDVMLYDDNEYNQADMILYGNTLTDEDNYFIELSKADKHFVLEVSMEGNVKYFKDLSRR